MDEKRPHDDVGVECADGSGLCSANVAARRRERHCLPRRALDRLPHIGVVARATDGCSAESTSIMARMSIASSKAVFAIFRNDLSRRVDLT